MLRVICVVGRTDWRNFQNATGCFGIQPCGISTYFDMLQRRIVFRCGEHGCAIRIYRAVRIGMAIAAADVHGSALRLSIGRTPHEVDACMAVNTAHSGGIVHIGCLALDAAAIGESQRSAG